MSTIANLYIFLGILMVVIAIPLILRKVKPNLFYGFRTPFTMSREDVWYDINAYFGRWLLVTGVIFTAASLFFRFIPGISVDAYASICTTLMLIGLALAIGLSVLRMRKFREQ